jgi:prepilin-type N-terminal cleavage/methylation domain-containing protein
MKRLALKNQGFTMIEIVAVLVVLLIVSTVVISRYTTTGTNELMVETDGLKASLRYAQIQSLNDDTATWGIYFPNNTSYTLYKNGAAASVMIPVKILDTLKDPTPNNTHKLQGNVEIAVVFGTTINFNKWGSPIDGSGNPLNNDITITLTKSGQPPSFITITKNTGYIP